MKLIEKTLMERKMRYDTESTDYSLAKEMANKIMINNSHVCDIYLGKSRATQTWIINLTVYSKEFIEKHSK